MKQVDEFCRLLKLPDHSVHHLLELLHWQHTNSLACWLGLEEAWLLGERVDTLTSSDCWLFLQLHVQHTSKLELAILLQLCCGQLEVCSDHCLHVLRLQF